MIADKGTIQSMRKQVQAREKGCYYARISLGEIDTDMYIAFA